RVATRTNVATTVLSARFTSYLVAGARVARCVAKQARGQGIRRLLIGQPEPVAVDVERELHAAVPQLLLNPLRVPARCDLRAGPGVAHGVAGEAPVPQPRQGEHAAEVVVHVGGVEGVPGAGDEEPLRHGAPAMVHGPLGAVLGDAVEERA